MNLPRPDNSGLKGYQHYQKVLDEVIAMLEQRRDSRDNTAPSDYWQEELSGFEYMFEATPLLINKLRHHSYHLTGLKVYDYRSSQAQLRASFETKLRELQKADKSGLFIPESPILGGFGHDINGARVNIDTLKFYESLIALDKGGVLSELKSAQKPVIAEVGSGWGGFAFQMKTVVPKATYVLIDFPEVFLFSAVYLMTAFPGAKCLFVKSAADEKLFKENLRDYDFVFLPQELFNKVWDVPVDLAVNMVSFQEMTTAQVDNYAKRFRDAGVKWLYSHNRDRSKHNTQLSLVSSILSQYYDLTMVPVLNGSYTNLNAKAVNAAASAASMKGETRKAAEPVSLKLKVRKFVGRLKRKIGLEPAKAKPAAKAAKAPTELRWLDYRHYVARPKSRATQA